MLSHEEVQAALSARLDGESTGLDDAVVDAHLDQCEQCRAYWDRLLSLSRNLGLAEVGGGMAPPPDLSEVILAGVEGQWRRFAQRRALALALARVGLVFMACVWAAWAIRFLVTADPAAEPATETAVRLGVASALAFAAWKPGQIPGILLIVGTMFTFTLGFAVRDILVDSASGVLGPLLILLFSFVALVATWAIDKGADVRRAWRMLSADPA